MNSPRRQMTHGAVIIIGRNEGERLERALASIADIDIARLYVDSGSTDGSPDRARAHGFCVLELNSTRPFSASRARREGAAHVLRSEPNTRWIQFLDGDCELNPSWLEYAQRYIEEHDDVAIVCGRLTEREPHRSIYNRVNALQWNAPLGDIDACGGIFCIRRSTYEHIRGFNAALLTGEEAELCARVRRAGGRIVRIDRHMARHDAGLLRFRDWWRRAIWGGYGDAIEMHLMGHGVSQQRRKAARSSICWGLIVPIVAAAGLVGMIWWPWLGVLPILALLACVTLGLRIAIMRQRRDESVRDAMLYAAFCILRKLPNALGMLWYWLTLGGRRRSRPDPHTARRPGSSPRDIDSEALSKSTLECRSP